MKHKTKDSYVIHPFRFIWLQLSYEIKDSCDLKEIAVLLFYTSSAFISHNAIRELTALHTVLVHVCASLSMIILY
jgi:hypothetical protein